MCRVQKLTVGALPHEAGSVIEDDFHVTVSAEVREARADRDTKTLQSEPLSDSCARIYAVKSDATK